MATARAPMGLMLPLEFYQPIGEVVAAWAQLEAEFDDCLELLHRSPDLALLGHIPASFSQRVKRMEEAAPLCFPASPTLANRFIAIAREARRLGRDRNIVVHGRIWFWTGGKGFIAFNSKREVPFTLEFIQALRFGIGCLTAIIALIVRPQTREEISAGDDPLAPDERDALQTFRTMHPTRPDLPHGPMPPSVLRQLRASQRRARYFGA